MDSHPDTRLSEQDRLIAELRRDFAALDAQNTAHVQQIDAKCAEIAKEAEAYAIEVAGRRGYERTVGLVLTVSAGAAIGLGVLFAFLGVDKLDKMEVKATAFEANADAIESRLDREITGFKTELDTTIDDKIALFFERDDKKKEVYEKNAKEMEDLVSGLSNAEKRWQEILPAISGLESYDPDADLKGDYLALIGTGEIPLSDGEPQEEEVTRAQKVGIVLRVTEHLKEAEGDDSVLLQFSPADVFNVAQIARELERPDLERQLVNAAYGLDKTMSTRAQYLQMQTRYGSSTDRDAAFTELMNLVTQLTMDFPQIVIAEAWNAAEQRRRYDDLIDALDRQIAAHRKDPTVMLPSSAYAVKGNAHQRRGLPGDLDIARDSYLNAIARLSSEGTNTQWSNSTVRDTLTGTQELLFSGIDVGPLLQAAEDSRVLPLIKAFDLLEDPAASPQDEALTELLRMLGESGPDTQETFVTPPEQN